MCTQNKSMPLSLEDISVILIPLILVILFAAGYQQNSLLILSIAMGSIGGIVHDLIENKGLVVKPSTGTQGVRLGIFVGTLLGGVSGFLGYATFDPSVISATVIDARSLATPLTWGIGLKGLVGGAAGPSAKALGITRGREISATN